MNYYYYKIPIPHWDSKQKLWVDEMLKVKRECSRYKETFDAAHGQIEHAVVYDDFGDVYAAEDCTEWGLLEDDNLNKVPALEKVAMEHDVYD